MRSVALQILRQLTGGTALAALAAASWATADDRPDARQVWQLLDYLAVDYGNAVDGGQVKNAAEYAEMQEFAAAAETQLAALPHHADQPALIIQSQQLRTAITQHAEANSVTRLARTLADAMLVAYSIPVAPRTVPDLGRGAQLFEGQCAACHGPHGAGDGPLARSLNPSPIAFTDAQRARERSPFALYQIIGHGIAGTSMPGFSTLPEADRWALAYYAGGLAYSAADRAAGEQLWQADATVRAAIPDLETLSRRSQSELAATLGLDRAGPVLGYLRSDPAVVIASGGSLSMARMRLRESARAYQNGDAQIAKQLALAAYLDGFEPIEPILAAHDSALLARVEAAFADYRGRIARGAAPAEVASHAAAIQTLIDIAERAIDPSQTNATTLFLGSFTILLREGIEALLIVVAIVAFLRKAERTEVMRYVHWGWIGALGAGALTWAAATQVVQVSGASRELTEGLSSVFAALVLISVGLWMHHKSIAGRWQQYLHSQLTSALSSKRSGWFLGGLAFVAVYREVFETILFYAALWSEGQHAAIAGGLLSGSLALVAVALLLLRATRRLPIAQFFSISSMLIGVLAFVLIGKGVQALQEAGALGVSPLDFPRMPWLAIYPTAQSLAAQFLVLLCIGIGFAYNYRGSERRRHAIRIK